jgi:rhodanese-related sulfurtransferase
LVVPKDISVTDARTLQQEGHPYIDVRSSVEYANGHPAGAINIPLLDLDPASGQMQPNPDFVRVVEALFPPETTLLIGCQVGGRSARAARMLESFGFANVVNVAGGFGGARDPLTGQTIAPGWVESGLPVETTSPPGQSYDELVARADRQ